MARCPYCEATVSDTARKCRYCGEWLAEDRTAAPTPPVSPPSAPRPVAPAPARPAAHPSQVTVNVNREESVAFAVVTLLLYIFLYPVGFLLNLVGLITGPKRGCFLTLILLFVVLPIVLLLILTAAGIPVADEIARELNRMF